MLRYKKFIIAVIGLVLLGLESFGGFTIPYEAGGLYAIAISLLTAFGVLQAANAQ